MNRSYSLPTLTTLALCVTGCSNVTKDFIGDWSATSMTYEGEITQLPYEYTYTDEDGTYTSTMEFSLGVLEEGTAIFESKFSYTSPEENYSDAYTFLGSWAQSDSDKRTFELEVDNDETFLEMSCTLGTEEDLVCDLAEIGGGSPAQMEFERSEE
jgi:hypothetical protein